MRLVGIVVAIVLGQSLVCAHDARPAPATKAPPTTDQLLKAYARRIIYSPDAPPTSRDELPRYLAANAVDENAYDVIKGPPWPMHLTAVLAQEPGARPVQLVFADKADKKLATLHAVEVKPQKRIVLASTEANIAAGFAAGKTYVVRLMQGKTVLAKAEITLKD